MPMVGVAGAVGPQWLELQLIVLPLSLALPLYRVDTNVPTMVLMSMPLWWSLSFAIPLVSQLWPAFVADARLL